MMFDFTPHAQYQEASDTLEVYLGEDAASRLEELDENRHIHVTGDARPVCIEFKSASKGINLADVPRKATVQRLIEQLGGNFTLSGV